MKSSATAADPLSGTLGSLCLPDWNADEARMASPWVIDVPAGIASFYVIRGTPCQLLVSGHARPLNLDVGDHLILAHGTPHRLGDQVFSQPVVLDDFLLGTTEETHDRRETAFVRGHFASNASGRNPYRAGLPEIVRINQRTNRLLQDVAPLLDVISREQIGRQAGWQAVVNQLVRVLFVETLRAFLIRDENDQATLRQRAGWLHAALDISIGPALGVIHSEPEKPWTVRTLAKQANMSRTAFTQRFGAVVGKPPLQYLTEFRMLRACELLRETELGIKRIAALVGYQSASSFSSTFKRRVGRTPLSFRKRIPDHS